MSVISYLERKNRKLVFLANPPPPPCSKWNILCIIILPFHADSIWSQCAHWWMMSSTNGWRAWRKTLRRTWDPDCSGTSSSSPGGPPTMWVSVTVLDRGFYAGASHVFYSLTLSCSLVLFFFVAQVSDWWEEYIYLRGRGPIMVNSNYYAMVRCLTMV